MSIKEKIILPILIFLLIFSTIFALFNLKNSNINSEIHINNFDVSKMFIEDAKNRLSIVKANATTNNLEKDMFVDTLSTYSSQYNINNKNRTNNVVIATNKINGIVIFPGETFSYNQVVGERTISAGFKEASVYTSNGIEYGVGGGICQVSSTLYNAVLKANLEIIERKNHRYSVSYVPLGCDATVAYGSIDFKFKNSRNFPVKLQAYANNGEVSISVIGTFEDTEYDVSIETKKIGTIPFDTKYVYDSSLPTGSQIVKQKGSYGYKVDSYKVVKLNGVVISKSLISSDSYFPLSQIVHISN